MRTHWKKFEHGVDTEVQVWSAAKAEALEQAALVMMDAITSPDEVQARDRVDIACEAPDDGRARCCVPNQICFAHGSVGWPHSKHNFKMMPMRTGL